MKLPDLFNLRGRLLGQILSGGHHDSARASEAVRRLEDLEWMLVRCRALEAMAVALSQDRDEDDVLDGRQEQAAIVELRILVESFYHCAWRLIVLLDDKDGPVEGFSGIKRRCSGIRDVRNQLLAHPEGSDSRVFDQSFSYGDPEGPKLKPIRVARTGPNSSGIVPSGLEIAHSSGHAWIDRGMYVNAAELAAALDALLPPSPPDLLELRPRGRA